MSFTKGHALVVGVGTFKHHSNLDVPITVDDAQAVYDVLVDEKYCGYPSKQVTFLKEEEATRSNIKNELLALGKKVKPTDTVFIFLCSHGVPGVDDQWYFTTHDTKMQGNKAQKTTGGLSESQLINAFRKIDAARVFIVFNACFSGSISPGSLAADDEDDDIPSLAPSNRTTNALLGTGKGRIIMTASGEKEKSYFSKGEKHTIFTDALVDGLKGKGTRGKKGFISAFNLYENLHDKVQTEVKSLYKRPQNPELTVLKGIGSFAVSLYKGGGSLSVGDDDEMDDDLPAGGRSVTEDEAKAAINQVFNTVDIKQSGGLNIGGQNVNIGGSVVSGDQAGGDIIKAEGNVTIDKSKMSFGNINTGGGMFNTGDINTGGGSIAGRDIVTNVIHSGGGGEADVNPLDQIKKAARSVRNDLDDFNLDDDMYEAIDDDLNAVLKQLRKDDPNSKIIKRKLESAAEMLSDEGKESAAQPLLQAANLL